MKPSPTAGISASHWEAFPAPVWIGSTEGECQSVSRSLCRLLKVEEGDLLHKEWLNLVPPSEHGGIQRWIKRCATRPRPTTGKLTTNHGGGRRRWSVEARCFLDENQHPQLVISVRAGGPPPHQTKHQPTQEERLRLCFEHAPVGIGFLDLDLRFIQSNPFLAKRLTGSSRPLEGRPLRGILHTRLATEAAQEIERICSNTVQHGKPHTLHSWPTGNDPAGLPRFADWEIRRIESATAKPLGLLITVSDVTRQKYVEERMRLLASVLESTPDLVAVFSTQGRVLYLNKSAITAAGLDPATAIHNLNFDDIQPEWAGKILREEGFPTALETGIWEGETAFHTKEHGDIPVSQVLFAHKNTSGEVEFLSSILRDISEAHHFREQLARAQEDLETRVNERTAALAEASSVIQDRVHQQAAIATLGERALSEANIHQFLKDGVRTIVEILRVDCCSLRELSPDKQFLEQLTAAGWPARTPQEKLSAGGDSPSGLAILTGEPVVFDHLENDPRFEANLTLRQMQYTSGLAVPMTLGNTPFGSLSVFSKARRTFSENDIHFLQSMANIITAAIQRHQAEAGIQKAWAQAESANRAKSAFLSRMSHELRTPLNAVLGFTQLLKMEDPTTSQLESIDHISRAGQHLLALIDEVLDISNIESGVLALTLEPVELNTFIHNCVELMRPLAARTNIGLNFMARETPFHVKADRQRLKQVLLNFLSNAIKYNNEGGEVLISLRKTGAQARFEVRDTGPGIPHSSRALLFKPFERLGAEDGDIEGTGIGLALCKGFLEAMGGSIGLDNPDGGGCVFWAQLPIAEPSDEPQLHIGKLPEVLAPHPPIKEGAPIRILYIESHDFDLQLLERLLKKQKGFELISAMQGTLGLELAREHSPEVLLVDTNLPDLPAKELVAKISRDPILSKTPIVLLGPKGDSADLVSLAKRSNAGLLLKPYEPAALWYSLKEALARAGREIKF